VPLEDEIATMAVIEAVFRAGNRGGGKDRNRLYAECAEDAEEEGRERKSKESQNACVRAAARKTQMHTVFCNGRTRGLSEVAQKVDDPLRRRIRALVEAHPTLCLLRPTPVRGVRLAAPRCGANVELLFLRYRARSPGQSWNPVITERRTKNN